MTIHHLLKSSAYCFFAAEYEYNLSTATDSAIELLGMATDDEEEAVNAPLMRTSLDGSQESKVTSSNAFIWALTFAAAISGLLFGYEYVEGRRRYQLNADLFKYRRHFLDSRFHRR